MKTFLILLILCWIGGGGIDCRIISNRVFGGRPPTDPRHACVILVVTEDPAFARLGAGTIISNRHVLTSAHLIVGFVVFRIGHGWTQPGNMLARDASVINTAPGYDPITFANDIGIITLPSGQTFNLFQARLNVAVLPETAAASPTGTGYAIGWGFTAPSENVMSANPYEADLSDADSPDRCIAMLPTSELNDFQICAVGSTYGACPGDGGSGLYEFDVEANVANLVGVLTVVSTLCEPEATVIIQGFSSNILTWIKTTIG